METDLDKELRQMQNEKKMFENEANLDKARFVLHLRETLGQEMLADLAEMEKELPNSGGLAGLFAGENDLDEFYELTKEDFSRFVKFCIFID